MRTPARFPAWIGLLFVLAMANVASPARAQWGMNGTRLYSATNFRLYDPLCIGDGTGGAYFALRRSPIAGDQVRVLRWDRFGFLAPGWDANGLVLPHPTNTSDFRDDGCLQIDGSVSVVWERSGENRIHLTRLRPDGTVAPGWSLDVAAAPGVSTQRVAKICRTPDDGNFVLWQAGGLDSWDVWMTRLTATGQTAPGWPAAGHEVGAGPGMQYATSPVISDDGDGAWLAYFSNLSSTDADVFVLRTDAYGNPADGFPLYGLQPTHAAGAQAQPWLARDGADGVFVAWCDARSGAGIADPELQNYYDIYLQHLTGTGGVAPGWPADGLPVCIWPGSQQAPEVLADGGGGAYVGWEISGPQGQTIHVQHVLADGSLAPGWPTGGKRMFGIDTYADNMTLVTDQMGGVFVCGELFDVGSEWRVYVQHVTYGGGYDAVWGAMGVPLVTPLDGHDEVYPRMTTSLPGSVIVCWNDVRSGTDEAYASRVTLDGVVAATVSLASQDASADAVALVWQASEPLAGATVERRRENEDWRTLASIDADGTGALRFEDRDVVPGERYAYRLAWSEFGEARRSSDVWVTVPLATRFALAGARPNPASRADLRIAYSLAEPGPAQLELFDAQGRSVARHDVAAPEPGAHSERFGESSALRSGLYWLRLTQGERSATTRVVLVD